MSPTLLYLLKANGALLLFAAAYFGLLRRLTFFTLNRFYLLFALLFAAVYPALPVPALLPAEIAEPTAAVLVNFGPSLAGAVAGPTTTALDWELLVLGLYAGGAGLLLVRLLVQLLSLGRLRRTARPAVVQGRAVRILAGDVSPFSFWQTIYLNPARHPAAELDAVLRHEQVHLRQWHTPDVLLAQVAQALAWCNPAAWLLRRALLDNLEYLADRAALQTGLDRRAYQYSLLRLSHGPAGPSLVSHFTFPTLKNRVAMMNTPFSSTGQLARYFVAGPLVLAVALGFSAARAQGGGPALAATTNAAAPTTESASPAEVYPRREFGPAADPAKQPQLPASIKAYIAKTYPSAKLTSWAASDKASAKSPYIRYVAGITEGTRKQMLYFNNEEQPVTPAPRTADQRAVPTSKPAPPVITGEPYAVYIDGELQKPGVNLDQLLPIQSVANIQVFKGEQARQRFGAGSEAGVIIVTTKANESRADVVAFNQKARIETTPAPATNPEKQVGSMYLAAPALAYITKNHPEARLISVTEIRAADGKTPLYKAEIAVGRRPQYLVFDGAGQLIP